ncbi:hypothetical protein AB0C06_32280 [Micromonospora inaquosa]|jgi:hypothetical protein|uniref:Outer membrane channel protein CpnT-like N-terminal domain-containing protein n=1 Tax=Micromonospora inaquosa TaxID=2203716 RepID=A0A3N9X9D3_9ACTN|nr:hypothetical protein [Micromonospora inaquosa]RQX02997.1 hypothetical protein DLJ59_13625 [Micromonospora inaquosa]
MGLQLPGELVSLLSMLGYDWPTSDEEKLFELGQAWLGFSEQMANATQSAGGVAQEVWASNQGLAINAFREWWTAQDSAPGVLDRGANGAATVGIGLIVCAGVVLALKISVIVQLVILAVQIAQAIATAVATFGASLVEIPIFKIITSKILDLLIDQAVSAVLGG